MNGGLFAPLTALFGVTDEQAMWRVQMEDDPRAFGLLVERWEPDIQRLCARVSGSQDKGRDLAQEAFARLYARRKDYSPSGKFSCYLQRIALNICYDDLRRIQRRRETSLEDLDPESGALYGEPAAWGPTPGEAVEELDRAEHVRRALLRLPEVYRSVIVLRHYEDLKFREIGDVLGIPEGTVKSRMAEGLSQLHGLLAQAMGQEGSKRKQRGETILL